MTSRIDDLKFADRVNPPPTAQVQRRLLEYMGLTDMSAQEVAERTGYARSTVNFFVRGAYGKVTGDDRCLRAAMWDMMERNPIRVSARNHARLFPTENYRRIQKYFEAAIERGEVCLLYGPPGTQKSFVLEYLVAERNRKKLNDAVYVYASCDIRPLALLKRIGRQAGVPIKTQAVERMISGLLAHFASLDKPPAILVDEAQHLHIEALEILREVHDRSGCGLVLAGSHNLYENFLRGRAQLEQWLSRIDHKDPLPGLQENEVHEIAARELGNGHPSKLTERQLDTLVKACRVDDVFARSADGKPEAVKYLSVRRLVKVLAQHKAKREAAA
jgi:DNA transposition AAA+ family ATPase